MKQIKKYVYLILTVAMCLSFCCACNNNEHYGTETKQFFVNNEVVGFREFVYDENGLCKFIQTDLKHNEIFVIENIDGYVMSGGETHPLNPNMLSVYLDKLGENGSSLESIEYLFLDGKINQKMISRPGHNGLYGVTVYNDNCEELFGATVSDDNVGGRVFVLDSAIQENTKDNRVAIIKYFDENDGSLLYYEKYLYSADKARLGYVLYDAENNQIEMVLDSFVAQYRLVDDTTVDLLDYAGNSYGTRTYKNGYLN